MKTGGRRLRRRVQAGAVCTLAVAAAVLAVAGFRQPPAPAPLPPHVFVETDVPAPAGPMPTAVDSPANSGGPDGGRPQHVDSIGANWLSIPAIGVSAPVDQTGLDRRGNLALPRDVRHTTMWDGSASIDAGQGTVLLAGHVDDKHQGRGAMWPLHQVQAGDVVFVSRDSVVTRWVIVSLQAVPKSELPSDVFDGPAGPRQLKLVTCGGQLLHYGNGLGSYADNVIATALPA